MFNFAFLCTIICKCCYLTLSGLIYLSAIDVMHPQVTQTSQMGLSFSLSFFAEFRRMRFRIRFKKLTVKFRGKPSIKLRFLPLIFALEPDYVA